MNYRSQRFAFAVLVGIVLNLFFTMFIKIACWGPLISVIGAAFLAKAISPRDGAITGAIVFIPSSVGIIIQTIMRANTIEEIGLPLTIIAGLIGVLVGAGLGGFFGLIIGKFFQLVKDNIGFL